MYPPSMCHSCCDGGIEGQVTRIGQEMNPNVQKLLTAEREMIDDKMTDDKITET